ncbi:MAG: DUF4369 domain-containing protein [Bacteroidetes bacterium]|uniref:DUF4369 domain-containing protein n=1 Tax=Candidatus Limisoma faecipullorum TaxID=2840854 RepID=A0A9D9IPQ5_9BACT|nr:DUF4369 domain-containing protein [Candidatus Limisoma faecipullorum]
MKAIKLCIFLVVAFSLASCGEDSAGIYRINGSLVNGREASNAYLYVFYPEYQKVRLEDSTTVVDGAFMFEGRCDLPAEAYVGLDGEMRDVCSFILTGAVIDMKIGNNSYIVTGTADNDKLSALLTKQHTAVNERMRLQKEYQRLQADSVLTKAAEDSLLNSYRNQSVGLRESVLAVLNDKKSSPLLSRMVFRMFSSFFPKSEADSLALLVEKMD